MGYSIDWIVPHLRKPSAKLWDIASSFTFVCVGIFTKIVIEWLNRTKIYNRHIIDNALDRPPNVPLITISNHHSCFDDPGLWGTLKIKHLFSRKTMRWSLAAHDICFTNTWHSYFFMLGKCIPVVRGNGVFQAAVDLCIERVNKGDWLHLFPEGKVNMTKETMRFKWGIGRIIYESEVPPIIVPIWHEGMDQVLPNEPPYVLRLGKKLTFNFGKPLDLTHLVKELRARNAPEIEARKIITDYIEAEMMKLKKETLKLHKDFVEAS